MLAQFTGAIAARFSEIIVLDNCSSDGTLQAAIEAAPAAAVERLIVACNRANYGLGGSHKAAFAYASAHGFTHVLILHGDDQGSVADAEKILAQGLHRTHDSCLGARFARGSRLIGYSPLRILGNHVFNTFFTLGTRRRVLDLGSGLNILGQRVFADPAILRYADDLRFNVFLLLGLFDAGRSVMFFPISWREEDQISNVRMVSQALRTLSILRDYCGRRNWFRAHDFRPVKHTAYAFDIVFSRPAA